jgi:putative intracellular protease/amidase
MKLLIIVTSTDRYQNHPLPTGLWLSEVTHVYDECLKNGIEPVIASPAGGTTPLDPESLKPLVLDGLTKKYQQEALFLQRLHQAKALREVAEKDFDGIYLAGGHGTMYDFVGNETLNVLVRDFYENGKVISAVCHGVCGLLDVKLSNGSYLVKGKKLTGYSWLEEILAMRKRQVPFNLEQLLNERQADYQKGFIPLLSHVVMDGNLLTGQNPFSSKRLGQVVVERLHSMK